MKQQWNYFQHYWIMNQFLPSHSLVDSGTATFHAFCTKPGQHISQLSPHVLCWHTHFNLQNRFSWKNCDWSLYNQWLTCTGQGGLAGTCPHDRCIHTYHRCWCPWCCSNTEHNIVLKIQKRQFKLFRRYIKAFVNLRSAVKQLFFTRRVTVGSCSDTAIKWPSKVLVRSSRSLTSVALLHSCSTVA